MKTKGILVRDYCKDIRKKSHLSANAFAKEHNTTHTYIHSVENGSCDTPSIAKLIKLVNVYGLTEDDLMKTTIDPYFIDELLSLNSITHPLKAISESTNSRLVKFANYDLKTLGYKFDNGIDLKAKRNLKFQIKIYFDKYKNAVPIYDGKGTNKDNQKCYLYLFPNYFGEPTDTQLLECICNHICIVKNSIKFSSEINKNEKFEVLFLTSSTRIFEQACELIDKCQNINPILNIKYLKKYIKKEK